MSEFTLVIKDNNKSEADLRELFAKSSDNTQALAANLVNYLQGISSGAASASVSLNLPTESDDLQSIRVKVEDNDLFVRDNYIILGGMSISWDGTEIGDTIAGLGYSNLEFSTGVDEIGTAGNIALLINSSFMGTYMLAVQDEEDASVIVITPKNKAYSWVFSGVYIKGAALTCDVLGPRQTFDIQVLQDEIDGTMYLGTHEIDLTTCNGVGLTIEQVAKNVKDAINGIEELALVAIDGPGFDFVRVYSQDHGTDGCNWILRLEGNTPGVIQWVTGQGSNQATWASDYEASESLGLPTYWGVMPSVDETVNYEY